MGPEHGVQALCGYHIHKVNITCDIKFHCKQDPRPDESLVCSRMVGPMLLHYSQKS